MEQTGNFGNIYIGVMGVCLLYGLTPAFLATLIAGTIMKIKGHRNNKRGLKIAGNILLIVMCLILLVFAGYFAWAYLVRPTRLELVRSPTRPSNVRVCLFRHGRICVKH